MGNGAKPPGSADKSLGDIVQEVTSKAQLLVKEEIELAKAEVGEKVKRLGMGAGFFAAAAFLLLLFTIFLFHTIAWAINQIFDFQEWVGFAIVSLLLLLIAGLLGLLGLRAVKKGSPPVPEMAIEEAKATHAAIERARS